MFLLLLAGLALNSAPLPSDDAVFVVDTTATRECQSTTLVPPALIRSATFSLALADEIASLILEIGAQNNLNPLAVCVMDRTYESNCR
jgi:hypothetical protein